MVMFMLLPLSAKKIDNYRYRDILESNIFRGSNQEMRQRTYTLNEAKKIKIDNFTRGNGKNSNDAIEILEKLIIEWHYNYFVFWLYQ